MNTSSDTAILVVSFGSSRTLTLKNTIEAIENDVRKAFPQYPVYRAFTSGVIIGILTRRDGIQIDDPARALARMADDGIRRVLVLTTHVIDGIENEGLRAVLAAHAARFERIRFTGPLLDDPSDYAQVAEIMAASYPEVSDQTALILVGHGTEHFADQAYARMRETFVRLGHPHIYMTSVEGSLRLDGLLPELEKMRYQKVLLAPFLVTAGVHAEEDMAGPQPTSLQQQLRAHGFETCCVMKGLGEYEAIRKLYMKHLKKDVV